LRFRVIDNPRSDASKPSITWRLRALAVNEASSQAALLFANPSGQPLSINGQVRGPLCEYATTLAAKHPLQPGSSSDPRITSYLIDIPESCLWEPAHPFRYAINWNDGSQDTQVSFGLRVLSIQRSQLLLNGQPYRFRGITLASVSEASLRELHDLGCNLLISPQEDITATTDQLGPFVLRNLGDSLAAAREQLAAAGPLQPSIACWCAPPGLSATDLEVLRGIDKMTLFARELPAPIQRGDAKGENLDGADLALLRISEGELEMSRGFAIPWLAVVRLPGQGNLLGNWKDTATRLDQATRHSDGCIGWVTMES
jgi:hypothetical protein